MEITVTLQSGTYRVSLTRPLDIAIPVQFDEQQVSVFGAPPARRKIYQDKEFIGDVREGGSCNCEIYSFVPHCNGTHTECVGHITEERLFVHDLINEYLIATALITAEPERAEICDETYNSEIQPDDLIITRKSLQAMPVDRDFGALIVRTLPNSTNKRFRDYGRSMPPYFSREAMETIATSGFRHLLVDVPSVDRLDDGGRLINHRVFWGIEEGANRIADGTPSRKTITELVYVPDTVKDGLYLLNLQVAPFMADAAPSRPVLYEVKKI